MGTRGWIPHEKRALFFFSLSKITTRMTHFHNLGARGQGRDHAGDTGAKDGIDYPCHAIAVTDGWYWWQSTLPCLAIAHRAHSNMHATRHARHA